MLPSSLKVTSGTCAGFIAAGLRAQAAQAYEVSKDAASAAASKVQETAASAYETGKQYVQHGSNVAAEKAQQAGAATQDAAQRTAEQVLLLPMRLFGLHWLAFAILHGHVKGGCPLVALSMRGRVNPATFAWCQHSESWSIWTF